MDETHGDFDDKLSYASIANNIACTSDIYVSLSDVSCLRDVDSLDFPGQLPIPNVQPILKTINVNVSTDICISGMCSDTKLEHQGKLFSWIQPPELNEYFVVTDLLGNTGWEVTIVNMCTLQKSIFQVTWPCVQGFCQCTHFIGGRIAQLKPCRFFPELFLRGGCRP